MSDIESEELILTLSLLDVQDVKGSYKGKSREDAPLSDEEIALNIQADHLEILLTTLQDHRFALSIDQALQEDTATISALSMTNQGELDDHLAALALEREGSLPFPTRAQRSLESCQCVVPSESSSTTISNTDITDLVELDSDETDGGEPSNLPHHGSQAAALEGMGCVICGDHTGHSQRLYAPCLHWYCRDCLFNLVEASTSDETLHPLRCCRQPLPVAGILPVLPLDLRSRFQEKSTEFQTPPSSRLYCQNQTCSAFLGSSSGCESEITCTSCNTRTCSACKNRAHTGENCAENAQALAIESLASEMGWQTCPGCNAIVELQQGCYHITCRCSTQFCYLCAARWKTCDCRQWDDQRLLDDAERRVHNEFGIQEAAARPVVFARRVRRMVEELEDHVDCAAHRWRFRHGGGRCEECHHDLPAFLMRCMICQVLACRRCSMNRL